MITEVYYQRNFRLGNFLYENIGVRVSLEPNQDPKQALDEAKKLCIEYNKENLPYFDEECSGTKVTTIEENEPLTPLEKMKLAINSCTDITVLESFKLLVSKNKEGLQETYDNKLKQLTK